MEAPTFFRLLSGFLLQVVPFGILAMYPFWNRLRVPKRTAVALIVTAIPLVGCAFAGVGCLLQTCLPGDATLFNAVNAVFLVCLMPCLVVYLACVKAPWQEKLFMFAFSLTCAWGITATADVLFTVAHLDGPYDGLPYQSWTPLLLLSLGAVFVPLLTVLLKKSYLPVRDGVSWKQSTALAILAAVLFVLLASIFIVAPFTDAANVLAAVLYLIVFVMVLAVYAVIFSLLRSNQERMTAQRETDRAEHMLHLQSQQLKAMEEAQRHDRRVRHDVRHTMAALRGLVASGDAGAAMDLIDGYVSALGTDAVTRYCSNEAVNSVVSYYAAAAREANVAFDAKVSLNADASTNDAELCAVLGNLLDNAVAAASEAAGARRGESEGAAGDAERSPWVRLGVAALGDAVAITVDNVFDGQVHADGSRYLSTKEGHAGLGLESVAYLAERRGGVAEFTHEDNVFRASVMLGAE